MCPDGHGSTACDGIADQLLPLGASDDHVSLLIRSLSDFLPITEA